MPRGRLLILLLVCGWLMTTCVVAKPAPKPHVRPHPRPSPSPSPTPNPLLYMPDPAHPPGAAAPGEPGAMSMQDSLKAGLAANPQIKIATEKVAAAVAQYDQAQSQKNLKFTFSDSTDIRPQGPVTVNTQPILGDQQTTGFPAEFNVVDRVQSQIKVQLKTLLTTFGKVENQILAAFLNIDTQTTNAETTQRSVIYSVKQGFLQQLKALAGEEAARLNLLVTEQSLSDTEAQFNQGLLARYDVVQAELQVVEATQQLAQRRTDISTTGVNLRTVLVLPEDAPLRLIPPAPIVVDPDVELKKLESLALVNRPEIRSLNQEMKVAEALLDAAKADNAPSVGVGLNYSTFPGNTLFPSNLVQLSFEFRWDVWDGGLADAKTAEAEAQIRSLQASGEQLRLTVLQQVQNAWLTYLQTKFNVETAVKRVETAAVYYDMARQRFKVGLATSLEVQQSVQALNNARVDQVVANYDRDLAFAQLEQALGTDFPDRHLTVASLATPPTGGDPKK